VTRIDVDALTDRLYAAAPEEFVAVRSEGVRQLKAADEPEAAASFAKLAKPALPAWAVNLLAAQRRELIDELIERGDALRRAHGGGGEAAAIRAAQQARQQAIRAATDAAVELTGRRLSDAHREAIATTLEAASSDPAAAEAVRRGRLVGALEAPTGFDAVSGFTVIAGGRSARLRRESGRRRAEPAAPDTDTDADQEAVDARAAILRSDAEAALTAAETANAAAGELRDRVDGLEAERERVDGELRRLDAELTAARRDLREAERAAADAARKAQRAAARAERGGV
jgi:hypothetical protein